MNVEINSVWKFIHVENLHTDSYRVLAHYVDEGVVVVFRVNDSSSLERPKALYYSDFLSAIKLKNCF